MSSDKTLLSSLMKGFAELVAPGRCSICSAFTAGGAALCLRCLESVEYRDKGGCRICGGPIRSRQAAGRVCGECLRRPPPYDRAVSLVSYSPEVRMLLLQLKYHGDTTVMPALAAIAAPALERLELRRDLIVPVPLHRKRLQHRGLNQALSLSRLFFPGENELIAPLLLRRKRSTRPQTGLNGLERRRNLKGAFEVENEEQCAGKAVLVVDDVFTTGTTVAECSRELRRAGASAITVLTFARVIPDTG